jgi:hypothetical protein
MITDIARVLITLVVSAILLFLLGRWFLSCLFPAKQRQI